MIKIIFELTEKAFKKALNQGLEDNLIGYLVDYFKIFA